LEAGLLPDVSLADGRVARTGADGLPEEVSHFSGAGTDWLLVELWLCEYVLTLLAYRRDDRRPVGVGRPVHL
jgi:hypothetical protein